MVSDSLIRSWVLLVGLSLGTTVMSLPEFSEPWRRVAAVVVLMLAGLKARIILQRYLALAGSRFWTTTFDVVIAGFLLLAIATYMLAAGR
jgi:hypothetical protein